MTADRPGEQQDRTGARHPYPEGRAAGRVGYVISRYPAYSHAFVETEIDALAAAGWAVHTFSVNTPDFPDPRGPHATWVVKAQRPITWLLVLLRAVLLDPRALLATGAVAVRSGLRRPRRARSVIWAIAYLVEALGVFDVARQQRLPHLHAHFANNGADVAWLASEFGARVARSHTGPRSWSMTVHGPSDFDQADEQDLAGKVAAARDVVCISDYALRTLRDRVPTGTADLHVVRMGVRFPGAVRPRESKAAAFRILFVGRMVPKKAPDVLLVAVDRLGALHDPAVSIEVTFAGAGPLLPTIVDRSRAVSATVRCVGALPHDQVLQLYGEHDVFCLPSHSEGLPVVLMEAMADGLAVVTTPVAGIPELVHDGTSGLLVPPGDAEALASALLRLAEDPALRGRLAAEARVAVTSMHDARTSADALGRLFGGS